MEDAREDMQRQRTYLATFKKLGDNVFQKTLAAEASGTWYKMERRPGVRNDQEVDQKTTDWKGQAEISGCTLSSPNVTLCTAWVGSSSEDPWPERSKLSLRSTVRDRIVSRGP